MTTGRINQVAFLHPILSPGDDCTLPRTGSSALHPHVIAQCHHSFGKLPPQPKQFFGQAGLCSFPLPHPRLSISPAVQVLGMSGTLYLHRGSYADQPPKLQSPRPAASQAQGNLCLEKLAKKLAHGYCYAWHTHAPTTSPCYVPNPTDALVAALSGPRLDIVRGTKPHGAKAPLIVGEPAYLVCFVQLRWLSCTHVNRRPSTRVFPRFLCRRQMLQTAGCSSEPFSISNFPQFTLTFETRFQRIITEKFKFKFLLNSKNKNKSFPRGERGRG